MTLDAGSERELQRFSTDGQAFSFTESSTPTAERRLRVWDLGTATRPLCLAQVEVDPSTGAGELTCMAPGPTPLQVIRRLLTVIDELQTT